MILIVLFGLAFLLGVGLLWYALCEELLAAFIAAFILIVGGGAGLVWQGVEHSNRTQAQVAESLQQRYGATPVNGVSLSSSLQQVLRLADGTHAGCLITGTPAEPIAVCGQDSAELTRIDH